MPPSQTKSGKPTEPSQAKPIGKPNSISASLNRSNMLVGGLFGTKANNEAKILPVEQIEINREQPRRSIDQAKLAELAEDIKQRGILQPPIVRPVKGADGPRYQLVVGERRFRAAQIAGLTEIPVIVREYDDQEAGAVSLVENLLRDDLDIEDEALYFRKLTDEHGLSTREIGRLISKGHLYVYRRLKLLERPDLLVEVREARLNLNRAVDLIAEGKAEAAAGQVGQNEDKASRFPEKQTRRPQVQLAWKKINQFTSYLREALPSFEITDEKDREGLRETIGELEAQLAELKKRI